MRNIFLLLFMFFCLQVKADNADVINAKIEKVSDGNYRIDVTVRHADEGWNHYADGWLVFTEQGEKIDERVLHHPHVNEMPFTRSKIVSIPENIDVIVIRAKDNVHIQSGLEKKINVPR